MLTIALAKGRLAKCAVELFDKCGIDTSELMEDNRKLVVFSGDNLRFILVKPADVPVYVYHGVADMGIAGKDTLLEAGLPLYEMADLGFAACSICVAGYEDADGGRGGDLKRVATKYPRIAKMYYDGKGEDIEIIKLNGSIELAPILDLSDVIVDIVESGDTLRENGLSVLEDICEVSARLVVNRVSLKTKADVIRPLIERIKTELEDGKNAARD